MTDDLRTALSAGDTPAGVDVGLVRARAHRLRRRRLALVTSAAAAVTAVAVAVPVGLLRADPAPPAAPATAPLGCPAEMPDAPRNTGPGLAEALVPFAPEGGLICSYVTGSSETGGLTGVARMTAAEVRSVVERLDRSPAPGGDLPCTAEFGYPYVLQVAGAERAVTLRLEPYGCGRVSNGARDVTAGAEKELLRSLGDRARASSQCPPELSAGPTDRPTERPDVIRLPDRALPGAPVVPEDARSLLLCRYSATGTWQPAGKRIWNAALGADDTRRIVAELNASPPLQLPHRGCIAYGSPDRGARLLLFAVAPDEVVPAWADAAGCVDNGVRWVLNKALVQELVRLT